jgi:hypothetical protein
MATFERLPVMRIAQAAICVGGEHDGAHLEPPGGESYPESLFSDRSAFVCLEPVLCEATYAVTSCRVIRYRPGSHRYSSASQT